MPKITAPARVTATRTGGGARQVYPPQQPRHRRQHEGQQHGEDQRDQQLPAEIEHGADQQRALEELQAGAGDAGGGDAARGGQRWGRRIGHAGRGASGPGSRGRGSATGAERRAGRVRCAGLRDAATLGDVRRGLTGGGVAIRDRSATRSAAAMRRPGGPRCGRRWPGFGLRPGRRPHLASRDSPLLAGLDSLDPPGLRRPRAASAAPGRRHAAAVPGASGRPARAGRPRARWADGSSGRGPAGPGLARRSSRMMSRPSAPEGCKLQVDHRRRQMNIRRRRPAPCASSEHHQRLEPRHRGDILQVAGSQRVDPAEEDGRLGSAARRRSARNPPRSRATLRATLP